MEGFHGEIFPCNEECKSTEKASFSSRRECDPAGGDNINNGTDCCLDEQQQRAVVRISMVISQLQSLMTETPDQHGGISVPLTF